MVSSTVYGQENLLDQVFASLRGFGYNVWMSHNGTLPVNPGFSAFESCLRAVGDCDVFFGIISPHYGSGKADGSSLSITHRELVRAIEREKPRWVLAHENVVNARRLLMDLGFDGREKRDGLKLVRGGAVIDDLRLIDMYEAATREDLPVADRTGNWVQKYRTDDDVLRYTEEQFARETQVRSFLGNRTSRTRSRHDGGIGS